MRKIRLSCFVPLALLFLAAPAPAQTTSGYTAPAEFMALMEGRLPETILKAERGVASCGRGS